MDAITSFSTLVDNLPLWKEQIRQLHTYTSQKHEEFRAEYSRIVSQVKPRRLRSPSICSIHTNDDTPQKDVSTHTDQVSQPPDLVNISPFEAGNRYIYAQATRKRKPGTSFRSGASGPVKFRSKQMVVIYYDSHVQDQLDSIVKSIGGCRNNLRKGKMSYVVSRGLQLPVLGKKYDLSSSTSGSDSLKLPTAYRSTSKISIIKDDSCTSDNTTPDGEEAFKQADKDLETCQSLCETAAHQFLRDGDCKLELDTVVQHLERVAELATATIERFRLEERKAEILNENDSITGSSHTESDATLVEKSSRELLSVNHKLELSPESSLDAKRPALPSTQSAPAMMTEIEVDDESDQSSIEIDLSKYRMPNRAGNRPGLRA